MAQGGGGVGDSQPLASCLPSPNLHLLRDADDQQWGQASFDNISFTILNIGIFSTYAQLSRAFRNETYLSKACVSQVQRHVAALKSAISI